MFEPFVVVVGGKVDADVELGGDVTGEVTVVVGCTEEGFDADVVDPMFSLSTCKLIYEPTEYKQ